MTVFGIFILRKRRGRPKEGYRTFGYPVTPVIFMIPILFSVVYLVKEDYRVALMSAGTVLVGTAVYFANKLLRK